MSTGCSAPLGGLSLGVSETYYGEKGTGTNEEAAKPTTQPGTARLGQARVACLSILAGALDVENALFACGRGCTVALAIPNAVSPRGNDTLARGEVEWFLEVVEGHALPLGLALLSRLGVLVARGCG